MRINTLLLTAFAALSLPLAVSAQQARPTPVKSSDYQFTHVKENPITSIKNQNRSGTCWCFSALSFLESEVIKAKGIKDPAAYPDFSEMFVVRNAYHDRAIKYVRLNGKLNMAAGSDFGDVLEVVQDYGIVPQSVFSGMNYGTELPVQGELDAVLRGYVEAVVKNPNRTLTPVWSKGFDGILDAYLGEIPAEFNVDGTTYTPESYRDAMGINTDDYIGITSFTHHPFYKPFAIEVEDNWRWSLSYNLPLDEFMAIIDNAVENGYTVLWGGDVSEAGFTRDGLAVLLDTKAKVTTGSDQERWVGKADEKPADKKPAGPAPEEAVTQESRQLMFDNKQSTDDHGMHLYGTAKDQNGNKYYLIKNSWGESGAYKGIWYMSENFCKAKTLNFVVNKNAIPVEIQKKLGIVNYGKTNRTRK
ncbi:MAG: aminopeptidase [Bacteroidales bacterium]|nr:aminopeptidase [Bacteroidales bacterium]